MKKTLLSLVMLTALVAFVVTQAEAATDDTIAVTVTLTGVSVSVSPDSWTPIDVATTATSGTITATNDSVNRTEDLAIVCSAGSSPWYIGATAGVDTFVMTATGGNADCSAGASIDTSKTLETDLAAAGTVDFTLTFTAPTTSTLGSDSMTVTVSAS